MIRTRPFLLLSLAFLLLALPVLVLPVAAAKGAEKSPNVVVFLVDDLGWTDVGCFGSTFYETPNIDALAKRGTRFTNGYAACPVCSPTRAAMLTGKNPVRVGITTYINSAGNNQPEKWRRGTPLLPAPYKDRLAHEEVTLAELFKDAGYATFFAGKWHLGPKGFYPTEQGFDENQGGLEAGGPYGGKKYFSPYGNPNLKDGPPGEHLPARLAQETCDFIEENKDGKFFAYLSFYSVHTPLMAREDLKQKYQEKQKDAAELTWGDEGGRKVREVQQHAVYAGMVEAMDQAVGKVLKQLETSGVADNTIVIFTSDNGGLSTSEGHPTSNLPLRGGKGWMYEGGIRVPLIIFVPGLKQVPTTDTPAVSMDMLPTLAAATGISIADLKDLDGVSLLPVIQGEKTAERKFYWHFPHYGNQGGRPGAAIRHGKWKLIEWYGLAESEFELFDLEADLAESKNVYDTHTEIAEGLKSELAAWRDQVKAKMPTVNK